MAITRVQSNSAANAVSGTTQAVVLGATPTDGNILVAAVAFLGTASVPGTAAALATTGVIWMQVNTATQGASGTSLGIFVGRVFSGASATTTATSAQAGGIALAVAEYSGLSQKWDQFVSATGSSTSPASGATATTATANELWIGAIAHRASSGGVFSSPTNSFTIVQQVASTLGTTSDRSVCLLERIVTGTGTPNAGATVTPTGVWVAEVLTIEETAGAGGGGSVFSGQGGVIT